MATRDTVQRFYATLKDKQDWETFLSDDLVFISNGKQFQGKETLIEGIRRFYAMVQSFEVRELLIDGEHASAVVSYILHSPQGKTFNSDVAEFFTIQDQKIVAFSIYFDTAPY